MPRFGRQISEHLGSEMLAGLEIENKKYGLLSKGNRQKARVIFAEIISRATKSLFSWDRRTVRRPGFPGQRLSGQPLDGEYGSRAASAGQHASFGDPGGSFSNPSGLDGENLDGAPCDLLVRDQSAPAKA